MNHDPPQRCTRRDPEQDSVKKKNWEKSKQVRRFYIFEPLYNQMKRFLKTSEQLCHFLPSQKNSGGGGGVWECFINIERASGDTKLMYSVNLLTNPAKVKCWRVQVAVDPLLWKRLGPDVKVNLVQCYTNTHLLIIHVHAHTPLCPMLGLRWFWTQVFQGKNFFLDPI